jgi:uncharacterized protein (TIRG00374 family)
LKKKTAETLKIIFFVALGLGLAWLSLRNIPAETLWENFKAVDPYWIILVLAVSLLSHVIRSLRWNMLLEPTGNRVKPMNAIMAVMSGYFINLALPRTGEIARCGLVNKYDKVPVNIGIGTVVAERVVDMIFLLIFSALTFLVGFGKLQVYMQEKIIAPLAEKIPPMTWVIILVLGTVIAIGAFVYLKRRKKKQPTGKKGLVEGFIDGLKSVMEIKRPFIFFLSSFSIWACYFLVLYIGFQAHPATKDLGLDACLAVFVFGTVGMIVTPGGIGAYPALVGQTLVLYGVDEAAGISFGWIIWGVQTVMFIILGPLSLIGFPVLNPANNNLDDERTVTS